MHTCAVPTLLLICTPAHGGVFRPPYNNASSSTACGRKGELLMYLLLQAWPACANLLTKNKRHLPPPRPQTYRITFTYYLSYICIIRLLLLHESLPLGGDGASLLPSLKTPLRRTHTYVGKRTCTVPAHGGVLLPLSASSSASPPARAASRIAVAGAPPRSPD